MHEPSAEFRHDIAFETLLTSRERKIMAIIGPRQNEKNRKLKVNI